MDPCCCDLRVAHPRDLVPITALMERAFTAALARTHTPEALALLTPELCRLSPLLLTSGHGFVHENEGRIAAAGGWSVETPWGREAPRGVGHLRHLVCDPALQRRGLGRAVLDRVLADAKASGIATLHAHALVGAEGFFGAAGFTTVARVDLHMQPGLAVAGLHLRADLAP